MEVDTLNVQKILETYDKLTTNDDYEVMLTILIHKGAIYVIHYTNLLYYDDNTLIFKDANHKGNMMALNTSYIESISVVEIENKGAKKETLPKTETSNGEKKND